METLFEDFASACRTDSNTAWLEGAHRGLRYQSYPGHQAAGEGVGAPAAVLIHELGGSLESWDGVADALAAALPGPVRLMRYDQRGQGGSARVREGYALADQTDDLHALLSEFGSSQPVWLIAAAAGATIAVRYAAQHPQHVAGLVLCAPALDIDAPRRRYLLERGDLAVREGMRAVVEGTMDNSWPPCIRTDARTFDAYRSRFLAQDAEGYAYASAALSEIELQDDLRALRCPCLFLAGEHDLQRPPARVAQQAALVAHACFEVVPQAGHLMAVQQPAQVAARVAAFLKGGR